MPAFTASAARTHFAEILSIVGFGKDRVVIEKHSRPIAAVVSIEELMLLDDLLVAARDDVRFRDRVASLIAARDHRAVVGMLSCPSDETTVTDDSLAEVLDHIAYPRPATKDLKDLMAADGD